MPAARASDPNTSHAAAAAVAPHVAGQQARVLGALYVLVWASDEKLVEHLPTMNPGSAIKRRGELVRLGLVRDSGLLAKTRSGCKSIVWQITEAGVATVQAELRGVA